MIVADSSVWIHFLRGTTSQQVHHLRALLADNLITLTGVIKMELLQGASDKDFPALKLALDELPLIETIDEDFDLAADIFRSARAAGNTVRRSVDCLIAAPCIRTESLLLHDDADFYRIAEVSPLRLIG